ncbi:hypothetical protein ACWIG5_36165 [Streptomyces lydicus]
MRGGSHQQQARGKVQPNSRERKPCRITEAHLPAPADLAPAGTGFDDEVLAKLAELEKRSAQHAIDLRPQNTVEGYAADWKQWETFCALLGLPTTAITPGSLTAFVEWLWVQPGWKAGTFTAPSTIDRRLSGVVVTGWHTIMDVGPSPEAVGDVTTRLTARADLPVRQTGHSPRRGAAEEFRRAGNDRKTIAKQGGRVPNSGVMEGYFEDAEGWEENAMIGVL